MISLFYTILSMHYSKVLSLLPGLEPIHLTFLGPTTNS